MNGGKSPFKMRFPKKVEDLQRLKVFGSIAYPLILQEKQTMDLNQKLQRRAIRCYLVGVGEDLKSFHFYNPKLRRVFKGYHVKVFEREFRREHSGQEDEAIAEWIKGLSSKTTS